MLQVIDTRQRQFRDLRISVTDRCNLRCGYCMPRKDFGDEYVFLPHGDLLSFEEIARLARLATRIGLRKIRLTGGEPLLRHGIERLVESLACLNDVDGKPIELAMTTNGTLLENKARALKDAGLTRLTVSLDALSDQVFRRMSDSRVSVRRVLDGIESAQAVGLAPVKVNTVIKRGINESEILPLVRHFRGTGVIVRFIEFMDVGVTNGWRLDDVVAAREIVELIAGEFPVEPITASCPGEVAKRWSFKDGGGEFGVIASVTQAFCCECNRLRLSTDGKLYTCLFSGEGTDFRTSLRNGDDDENLLRRIADVWARRADRYSELRQAATERSRKKIEMSYIGG